MTYLFTCLSKKSFTPDNGSGLDRDCIGNGSAISCKLFTSIIFLLLLGVGNVWGTDYSGTIPKITSYTSYTISSVSWTVSGTSTAALNQNVDGTKGAQIGTGASPATALSFSTSGISGTITSVTVYTSGAKSVAATVAVSVGSTTFKSGKNTSESITNSNAAYTFTGSASGTITISWSQSSSKALYVKSISVTYSTASCSANPSIGNASLNGSFNLSSIPLQASVTSDGGTGCTITDAGFVWQSGGSDPIISNNKTAGTYSTNITGTITGSFSTGVTYKIKAYATNGHGDGLSSSSFTLIPRSITFNSNGGSSVATKYVNNNTAISAPTAPTKTGYNFDNWYTTSGLTTTMNFSGNITKDTTLYAKWNAKTYSITLDREGGTTGATSVTMTYNSSSFTGWSVPSKEGHTFGGYWTGDNGTGTMVIDASGNLQANVTNYTGAGGIWTKDATTTLYAKWTPINYTVTWKVNDVAYTTGDPSDNADYGTAWSSLKLPTDPDPDDYCGDKFMGWTTDNIGVTGLDKDDDDDAARIAGLNLMTSANKSGKSTTISGNTIFYAVFANYAD